MFSPRPARGYRFHSLQVEIIAFPSQLQKLQPFSSKRSVRRPRFRWILNVLQQKIGAGNRRGVTLSWMPGVVTEIAVHPPHIVTECCSFVLRASPNRAHTASPSRGRDIGGQASPVLAGSRRREEDRALQKNNRRRPHAKQSSDRSDPASEE